MPAANRPPSFRVVAVRQAPSPVHVRPSIPRTVSGRPSIATTNTYLPSFDIGLEVPNSGNPFNGICQSAQLPQRQVPDAGSRSAMGSEIWHRLGRDRKAEHSIPRRQRHLLRSHSGQPDVRHGYQSSRGRFAYVESESGLFDQSEQHSVGTVQYRRRGPDGKGADHLSISGGFQFRLPATRRSTWPTWVRRDAICRTTATSITTRSVNVSCRRIRIRRWRRPTACSATIVSALTS